MGSTAAERVRAVEHLRDAGATVAAACAAIGITPSTYYRARARAGQGRRAARAQPPAPRPIRLEVQPAHWVPPPAPDDAWLHLAPPWSAPGAAGFSPFAVLKPIIRRPPPRRFPTPIEPVISAVPAPVVDRMAATAYEPLRLRPSLAHRRREPWHGALNGLAAAPAWFGRVAPLAALALIALLFGAALMRTAADPAAMHLSTAAADARLVAGAE
jgi:hypothetical protein